MTAQADPEVLAWLHAADDEVLECRGQGHELEKIRRRARGPLRNTRVEQRAGGAQIEWTCPACGTVRIRVIEPDGSLYPPVYYTYRYKANYRGPAGVTRRMCFEETQRRINEDAALAARKAAAAKSADEAAAAAMANFAAPA